MTTTTPPDWNMVLDVLALCETRTEESGLYNFGTPVSRGGVFVESGRVCWAAASGLQRRLTDLLSQSASLRSVDLDALHARCVASGKPLGRALLEEKLISPEELEAALRQHSAESLVALCQQTNEPMWIPRLGPGYSARLTFRPIDMLFDTVGLFRAAAQKNASNVLTQLVGEGHGVAFIADLDESQLLPIAAHGDITVSRALGMRDAAQRLQHAARELGAVVPFSLATSRSGMGLSVSERDGLLIVVACPDRQAIASVTARHLACMEATA